MAKSILNNKEALVEAINKASSIKEALLILGLRAAGGNYRALKQACEKHGVTPPSYDYKGNANNLAAVLANRIPDDLVFVENSTYSGRAEIKKRLYALGWEEKCANCGTGPVWQGKPLTLTLEHKNGIWNDHRLENLEILCPNCHSQTNTFAGRSGNRRRKPYNYCKCGKRISDDSKGCNSCVSKERAGRSNGRTGIVVYPPIDILVAEVVKTGFVKVASKLSISDTALRKHMKNILGVGHPIFDVKKRKGL